MEKFEKVFPWVEKVLFDTRNKGGEHCFLTAYQIAVFVDKVNPCLKGDLRIGGKGQGDENTQSFAMQIANRLSRSINDGSCPEIELAFFSLNWLDEGGFTFDGGKVPSANEFSMFRWKSPI